MGWYPYLSLFAAIVCIAGLVFTFIIGVDMEEKKIVIETKPHEAELRVEEALDNMFPCQWEDAKLVITIEKKD